MSIAALTELLSTTTALTPGSIIGIDQTTPGTTNLVNAAAQYRLTLPTLADLSYGSLMLSSRGELVVKLSSGGGSIGTTAAGADGVNNTYTALDTNGFGYAYNGSTWDRVRMDATAGLWTTPKPATTGGLTPFRVVTGTTGVIKASAGQVYTMSLYNANAAVRYVHFYNKATAPTLSTDTPVYTVTLTAGQSREVNLTEVGLAFATGISWAYTTDDVAIPTTAGTSTELHMSGSFK